MTDGFVVVCEDDGTIFGQGSNEERAWADARPWIEDALSDFAQEAIRAARGSGLCDVEASWRLHPATGALRASIGVRGGHDDWHRRPDGVLELGRGAPNPMPGDDT